LTSCANEDTFVNNIRKEIGNVLPGTLVQFQGQLH
jgi:hypothetical protein